MACSTAGWGYSYFRALSENGRRSISGCWPIHTQFGFTLPSPADAKMAATDQPKKYTKIVFRVPLDCLSYVMTRTLCVRHVVERYVIQLLFVKNVKIGQQIFVSYIYGINGPYS